jgi:putative transposase
MKRRRHTPEQIVRKLREVDRILGEGKTVADACRALEAGEQTFHRWRAQYGGMKANEAKRLKEFRVAPSDGQCSGWWPGTNESHLPREPHARRMSAECD